MCFGSCDPPAATGAAGPVDPSAAHAFDERLDAAIAAKVRDVPVPSWLAARISAAIAFDGSAT